MNKTSLTLALAVAAASLLAAAPAQAAAPRYGAYASVYGAGFQGGEGSFNAMVNSPANSKYAYGWAQASLADGTLHSAASAIQQFCAQRGCTTKTGTTSVVRYWDTVTFNNGVNMGLAKLHISVDGTLSPVGANASMRFYAGYAHSDFFSHVDQLAPSIALGSGTTQLGDELFVPLGKSTYFVFAELYTSASAVFSQTGGGWNASADFGNTLHFNWELPDGVTVSSASGRFMTAPVPEPATWAMAGAGLLALGWLQRRRRPA
jgi:hypothetical protein